MKNKFLLVLSCLSSCALADDFKAPATAEEVIDVLLESQPAANKGEDLWVKVPKLIGERDTLSGEDAAKAWFELFKKWGAKGTQKSKPNVPSLFAAIPAPSGWQPLDNLVRNLQLKPEKAGIMLRLLTATLLADRERQWELVAEFSQLEQKQRLELERLCLVLAKQTDDPAKLAAAFGLVVAGLDRPSIGNFGEYYWDVPDLIGAVGEENASAMLLKLLNTKNVSLRVRSEPMRVLARRLIVGHVDELATAPWGLMEVKTDEDAVVFEKLNAKFPNTAPSDAAVRYLTFQIRKGNIDAALAVFGEKMEKAFWLQALSRVADEEFALKEQKQRYQEFLSKLSDKFPRETTVWNAYIDASEAGKGKEKALAKLEAVTAGISDVADRKANLSKPLVDAELESGSVEKAVARLWQQLSLHYGDEAATILGRLYTIALVTEDDALMDKVLEAAAKLDPSTVRKTLLCPFLTGFLNRKDLANAWRLAYPIAQQAISTGRATSDCDRSLATLCELFVAGNRGSEAVKLMESGPWWSASQLGDLALVESWSCQKLGLIAAKAFLQADREQDARGVLKTMVFRGVATDDVFEKLVEIEGDRLIPYLDALMEANPFQERPLIWKAILLTKAMKLGEAETAIRQAIAIDPSDGESGKNDRLRTYAVLGDILEAKGDAKEAAVCRNVVHAVRMAEHADDLMAIGMRDKGIELYKTALKTFSDAYCIQSRLAIQLAAAGRMDEAMQHYEKAYELMPDSFGRIESHCFGCEKAFSGKTAQGLAERTFQKLIAAKPESPRLRYLLGYLRQNEGRYKEAAEAYAEAVRLDPDYYNAWDRLAGVANQAGMGFEAKQKAVLNLIRLDPMNFRRTFEEIKTVADLKQLWEIIQANAARVRKIDTPFWFPMAASMEVRNATRTADYRRPGDPGRFYNPAQAILEQEVVKIAVDSLTEAAR